jgi:hypothetical protein
MARALDKKYVADDQPKNMISIIRTEVSDTTLDFEISEVIKEAVRLSSVPTCVAH